MLRAEIAKARYLPLPRWTVVAVLAAAVITGAALIVFRPHNPDSYLDISASALNQVLDIAAMVFGVWVAALEFGSGTLQRTLTAEPDRNRVLTSKIGVVLVGTAVVGAAAAATVGGLTHLAVIRADAPVAAGDLARSLFALVPDAIFASAIGFGFGLLARSMGGGITFSLAFLYVISGVLSFVPGVKNLAYGQAGSDLVAGIAGRGDTVHNFGIALLLVAAWTVVILVPGWLLFLRADQK
jgi:ABC-2 type transport system permease protein